MSAASEQQPRRSFRLTDDEIWEYVASAHTGIMTTLRRDGMPIAMPLWFAAVDRAIYVHTRGKKLTRMAHDPRASFLFSEPGNTSSEGAPVPLAYGRIRVGSVVVSAGIAAEQLPASVDAPMNFINRGGVLGRHYQFDLEGLSVPADAACGP